MPASEQPLPRSEARLHLAYLDGLRGLAALYVVLYHASHWIDADLNKGLEVVRKALAYGHFAVAIFIVLSGYCLMLPVAHSRDRQLRGGTADYLLRRARRILPAYYAALLISMALIVLIPALDQIHHNYWDGALPALTGEAIFSHLFLVHNLHENWNWKIDPPLWSVATEWQIYFFFPLVLLPIWRRFGLIMVVLTGVALGFAPHFLLHKPYNIDPAAPWYLGLFTMGMVAATINFAQDQQATRIRASVPWHIVVTVLAVITFTVGLLRARWWWSHLWFADTLVGLSTATLLVYCSEEVRNRKVTPLLALFQSTIPLFLGTMSYSLYLVHAPLLAVFYTCLEQVALTPAQRLIALCLVGIPCVVGCSYLFHRLFERPFISSGMVQTTKRAEQAKST